MDSIFKRRMKENHKWFLYMSLIYGGIFVFCMYRNLSGITFPIVIAAALGFSILFLKKADITLQKGTIRYFTGIILLGISTVLTDNGFFHFFNGVGILLLYMMAMVHQLYQDQQWGFTEYVKKFFIFLGTWIISVGDIFHGRDKNKDGKTERSVANETKSAEKTEIQEENNSVDKSQHMWIKSKNVRAVLIGILTAMIMLSVVLPLLMMSDRVFSQIFNRFFSIVNPFRLLEEIDIWNIAGVVLTFLFGMVSLYTFFAGLFRMNLGGTDTKKTGKKNPVTGITFTGIMAAVYVLYSGIQIVVLFLRLDTGLPDGVTYSQYAHEGFWQLLFVSIINFVTVLICANIFEENRSLKILLTVLSICTCIMIISAAYRMILYVNEYNLTFLRVLVLWFLAVLTVIFIGVIYSIYRRNFGLFRYMTAVVSVGYILLSLGSPDALIANYNIENTTEMGEEDLYYLMYGLSDDAAPEIAKIDCTETENIWMIQHLDSYFRMVRGKNDDTSLREWNYSRARAEETARSWIQKNE